MRVGGVGASQTSHDLLVLLFQVDLGGRHRGEGSLVRLVEGSLGRRLGVGGQHGRRSHRQHVGHNTALIAAVGSSGRINPLR